MATDFYVTDGNDDYTVTYTDGVGYSYSYTSTTLAAGWNNIVVPYQTRELYIGINTSSIPDDDIIDSATVYYHTSMYTSTKGVTKPYIVYVGGSYITGKSWSMDSYQSVTLTGAQLNLVNKEGLTVVHITVPDPGSAKTRLLYVRSSEYTGTSSDPYMTITHHTPPTGYCDGEYSGTGDWLISSDTVCNTIETIPVDGNIIGLKGTTLSIHKGINITVEK